MDVVISKVLSIHSDVSSCIVPHNVDIVGIQKMSKMDGGIRDVQNNRIAHIYSIHQITKLNILKKVKSLIINYLLLF